MCSLCRGVLRKKKKKISSDTDRVVNEVPLIPKERFGENLAYDNARKPKLNVIKEQFSNEGRMEIPLALKILKEAAVLFRQESNILNLKSPLNICGDIHGQFFDLVHLFETGGSVCDEPYLFLGDYVDRGYFSTEVFLYLCASKVCFPDRIFLLRGNHECKLMTSFFTFKQECHVKYDHSVYKACIEVFSCLPLLALIDAKYLCVHAGISPHLLCLTDIFDIDRFSEPPNNGVFCDILWSDPMKDYGEEKSDVLFLPNVTRGCSYMYSYKAVDHFLNVNRLHSIIRGHEAMMDGYQFYRETEMGFPSLVTVFSAPNYCDTYRNKAAILKLNSSRMNIVNFSEVPHPYWLPNFMNAFTWSLPFVAEKVTSMLLAILNGPTMKKRMAAEKITESDADVHLQTRIRAIEQAAETYEKLRKANEQMLQLKGLIPPNLSLSVSFPSESIVSSFEEAKALDISESVLFETRE